MAPQGSENPDHALQAPMVTMGSEEPSEIVTKLRQALDALARLGTAHQSADF